MPDVHDAATRWLAAFNAHDSDAMAAATAPNALMEAPGDAHLEGRDAVVGYAMAWIKGFPDAHITLHQQLADGEWVAQRFTFDGTHTDTLAGPAGEIPATGRTLHGRGVQMLRIEDDCAAEVQLYFDQVQVLTQLGLMPATVTA